MGESSTNVMVMHISYITIIIILIIFLIFIIKTNNEMTQALVKVFEGLSCKAS